MFARGIWIDRIERYRIIFKLSGRFPIIRLHELNGRGHSTEWGLLSVVELRVHLDIRTFASRCAPGRQGLFCNPQGPESGIFFIVPWPAFATIIAMTRLSACTEGYSSSNTVLRFQSASISQQQNFRQPSVGTLLNNISAKLPAPSVFFASSQLEYVSFVDQI